MPKSKKKSDEGTTLRCVRCSTPLEPTRLVDETYHFEYDGHQCPSCDNQVLSMEQLETYNLLRDEARGVLQTRKIQKIGNSLGLTLPASFKRFIHEGSLVEVHVVNPKVFQIRVVSEPKRNPRKRVSVAKAARKSREA